MFTKKKSIFAVALAIFPLAFLPKQVDAANLTMQHYNTWCEDTKGGIVTNTSMTAGVSKVCRNKVNNKIIPNSGVLFNLITGIAKDYCFCDSNKNGLLDGGDEIKDPYGVQIVPSVVPLSDLSNPSTPVHPSILSSLNQASQNLFSDIEFNIWVAITLNSSGNLEMAVDLRDVPTLDQDPTFAAEGFTEMNLVYRDAMGSFSGIDLASLNQGEKNFLEFDPAQFDSFGDFSTWQLGVTAYNPATMQHVLQFEDKKVPEPTSTLSLLTLGTLGAAGLLRRKRKG